MIDFEKSVPNDERNQYGAYEAFRFLKNHPVFHDMFPMAVEVEVVKTNPMTKCIDDDRSRNTYTQVWLECSIYEPDMEDGSLMAHDYELDCGGDTYEEALIKLAELVRRKYGDY